MGIGVAAASGGKRWIADVSRVDEVLGRRKFFLHQCLLDRGGTLCLMDGGCRRVDMRNQVRDRGLARFTEVHHVPRPLGLPLVAIARLRTIR